MSSDREKQVEEVANFIINNVSLATSINLLIQNARETAEIIVDNGYEKEDFELYLSKSDKGVSIGQDRKKIESSGFFGNWEFVKKFPFIKRKVTRTGFSTRR